MTDNLLALSGDDPHAVSSRFCSDHNIARNGLRATAQCKCRGYGGGARRPCYTQVVPTRILGIIPARFASSRFPGKALALLAGKPMVQHVYERAMMTRYLREVIVATDDERIAGQYENLVEMSG